MSDKFTIKIDSRSEYEKDDTPVLITRGMLRQVFLILFNRQIELPFFDEGKIIEGMTVSENKKAIIYYSDGTVSECDIWDDLIESKDYKGN